MQQAASNPEFIHIWLMVGQYVLVPFAAWSARAFKRSIINELKAHVDSTMATHESGESGKFEDLSSRIGRIEDILMKQGLRKVASAHRVRKAV